MLCFSRFAFVELGFGRIAHQNSQSFAAFVLQQYCCCCGCEMHVAVASACDLDSGSLALLNIAQSAALQLLKCVEHPPRNVSSRQGLLRRMQRLLTLRVRTLEAATAALFQHAAVVVVR